VDEKHASRQRCRVGKQMATVEEKAEMRAKGKVEERGKGGGKEQEEEDADWVFLPRGKEVEEECSWGEGLSTEESGMEWEVWGKESA
jgi:hypothetical protein